jgi:invasion protein IalB
VADYTFSRNKVAIAIAGIAFLSVVALIGLYASQQYATPAPVVVGPGAQAAIARLPLQHFGGWTLKCIRDPRTGTRCALALMAVDKSKHLLLRLSVVRSGQAPVLVALTLPNALVSAGLTLTPEKEQPIVLPFAHCRPHACEAMTILTDGLATNLSAADKSHVRFNVAGRPVEFEIPTTGFADGYAAWQKTDIVASPARTATTPQATSGTRAPQPGEPAGQH